MNNKIEDKDLELRQGEIIGMQLSKVDFTDDIDLNKNCEDNPYAQRIT